MDNNNSAPKTSDAPPEPTPPSAYQNVIISNVSERKGKKITSILGFIFLLFLILIVTSFIAFKFLTK